MKIETLVKFVGVRKFTGPEVIAGRINWWRGIFVHETRRDVVWTAPIGINWVFRLALRMWVYIKYPKCTKLDLQMGNTVLRAGLDAETKLVSRLKERIEGYERRELEGKRSESEEGPR